LQLPFSAWDSCNWASSGKNCLNRYAFLWAYHQHVH
jgi:hypothetical protein